MPCFSQSGESIECLESIELISMGGFRVLLFGPAREAG